MGFAIAGGTRIQQVAQNLTQEGLVVLEPDGRPVPSLAESWSRSNDGSTWRFIIRRHVSFHDGTVLTAAIVRDALLQQLPDALGPLSSEITEITADSPTELAIVLKHPSTFLGEALSVPIHLPNSSIGTGPFYESEHQGDSTELRANEKYYAGKPLIDRVVIHPYASARSAWADLLRNRLDMLYEVGLDALDLMKGATITKVFPYQRTYSYVIVLNNQRKPLNDPAVRRSLNNALNREELVAKVFDGHGRPAASPLWPQHWANGEDLPRFKYEPASVPHHSEPLTFTCLYSDASEERLALLVQQQLQAIGVEMKLELVSAAEGFARAQSGNFDAWLVDLGLAPTMFRQYLFWHSGSPFNWGRYKSERTDAAFSQIESARSDDEYRSGVAAFTRAMIDDPPAVFLAWSERARAVSTRFQVPDEPGRDILRTMRVWRPVAAPNASDN